MLTWTILENILRVSTVTAKGKMSLYRPFFHQQEMQEWELLLQHLLKKDHKTHRQAKRSLAHIVKYQRYSIVDN